MNKKLLTGVISVMTAFALVGCSSDTEPPKEDVDKEENQEVQEEKVTKELSEYSHMFISGNDVIPNNIKYIEYPKYHPGTTVVFKDTTEYPHMENANLVVIDAYNTTAYAVSYKNPAGDTIYTKWVVQEEIQNAGEQPLQVGDEVFLSPTTSIPEVKATIDYVEEGPVYIVDIETADGQIITNYKWVLESEIKSPNETEEQPVENDEETDETPINEETPIVEEETTVE